MTPPPFTAPEHREACLDAALHLLREREERYPALIEKGRLSREDAVEGLERARCAVAQWRWIADPACPPLPPFDMATAGHFGMPERALTAELHRAATRARELADRTPADKRLARRADLYAALAWHQRPGRITVAIVEEVDFCRTTTAAWRAGRHRSLAA